MLRSCAIVIGSGLVLLAGCVNVDKPLVEVRGSSKAERVDPGNVPQTSSLPQCQDELNRSYAYIRDLERDNSKLREDRERYKRERDDARKRLKKYEDD